MASRSRTSTNIGIAVRRSRAEEDHREVRELALRRRRARRPARFSRVRLHLRLFRVFVDLEEVLDLIPQLGQDVVHVEMRIQAGSASTGRR